MEKKMMKGVVSTFIERRKTLLCTTREGGLLLEFVLVGVHGALV